MNRGEGGDGASQKTTQAAVEDKRGRGIGKVGISRNATQIQCLNSLPIWSMTVS